MSNLISPHYTTCPKTPYVQPPAPQCSALTCRSGGEYTFVLLWVSAAQRQGQLPHPRRHTLRRVLLPAKRAVGVAVKGGQQVLAQANFHWIKIRGTQQGRDTQAASSITAVPGFCFAGL